MNDDLYFDYLLQMGAMSPEEEKLARRQAQVDMLRAQSMQAPQAQQAGRAVVAPSWTQALAQVGQAYGASRGQKQLDQGYTDQSAKNVDYVKALRDRVAARRGAGKGSTPPSVMTSPGRGQGLNGEEENFFLGAM
jgi:hypothetical protein